MDVLPKHYSAAKSDRLPWGTDVPVFPVQGAGWRMQGGVKTSPTFSRVGHSLPSLLRVIWVLLTRLLVSVMSGEA